MSSIRVLIVDDHEITRRAIRSFLISFPELQICGEAVDGIEAVDKVRSLRPDVVLMDISMPRMNGLEATKVIKKDNPESKVIIVSQNDPAIVWAQAREAGAAAYVSKKDIGQSLLSTLRSIGDKRRPSDAPNRGAKEDVNLRSSEERQQRMTAEAVAATAKFRAVFEQSSVFTGIMTVDGKVIDANRLSLEACGYRPEEVLGRYLWETGWWRCSKEVQNKIRLGTAQAAQGTPYVDRLPYHWADGTERIVDFGLYPILDPQGKVIFLHPTGIDITERAQAEEELRKSEEKLRNLAEELETQVRARTRELEQRNAEVLQQSDLLSELSQRLLQTQDQERRHIARELHDSAGQIVTVLSMQMARIGELATRDSSQVSKITEDCKQLVQQLSQEIRTTSYLLYPPLLDEAGLNQALSWYIEGLIQRSGLEVKLSFSEGFGRLPREMELIIYRLVQECLTNIHRHSGSKSAHIRIKRKGKKLSLEIQDAGKGIQPEKLNHLQSQGGGVGIRGMRERIRQFDGSMNIKSNHSGTTISFEFQIPVNANSANAATGQNFSASV